MPDLPPLALALQGGGSHGALTWGVLDRLLIAVEAGQLHIAALSGTSAGALNAAVAVSGLVRGGPALARQDLAAFWRAASDAGTAAGNQFLYPEPGPAGPDLDASPAALAAETAGLIVSPYSNPFYVDLLAPVIERALPPAHLAALNAASAPRLFVAATDVANNARVVFRQPEITVAALRASACLPSLFRAIEVAGVPFWDGGFLGNPALTPLLDVAQDVLLVLVNAFRRTGMPPRGAPAIAERLNEITFNASVVLEVNAIEAVNRLLAELAAQGVAYDGRFRPIRLHAIRDDAFAASLGFVSKYSTSWPFLCRLRDKGFALADSWLAAHGGEVGLRASFDARAELVEPTLKR